MLFFLAFVALKSVNLGHHWYRLLFVLRKSHWLLQTKSLFHIVTYSNCVYQYISSWVELSFAMELAESLRKVEYFFSLIAIVKSTRKKLFGTNSTLVLKLSKLGAMIGEKEGQGAIDWVTSNILWRIESLHRLCYFEISGKGTNRDIIIRCGPNGTHYTENA